LPFCYQLKAPLLKVSAAALLLLASVIAGAGSLLVAGKWSTTIKRTKKAVLPSAAEAARGGQ